MDHRRCTTHDGDAARAGVVCARNVSYTLPRSGVFTDIDISARGGEYSQWDGEALPFINLDDDYEDIYENENKIVLWEKTSPGILNAYTTTKSFILPI